MTERDAILDFANALEAAAVNLKHSLGVDCTANPKLTEPKSWTWDPAKIKWAKEVGLKGEYEKSDDINSVDFKTMLKDLQEHQGKLNRDTQFYWAFQNGATVGRTLPK